MLNEILHWVAEARQEVMSRLCVPPEMVIVVAADLQTFGASLSAPAGRLLLTCAASCRKTQQTCRCRRVMSGNLTGHCRSSDGRILNIEYCNLMLTRPLCRCWHVLDIFTGIVSTMWYSYFYSRVIWPFSACGYVFNVWYYHFTNFILFLLKSN